MAKVRLRPESGMLYFDFSYKGKRCREYTTLQNTSGNRKKMERVLMQIEREIAFGSFDYGRYFPTSKRASTFAINDDAACDSVKCMPQVDTPTADQRSLPTFFDFTQLWVEVKKIEWRLSYLATVESVLNTHLYPALGEVPVDQITREAVLAFRTKLASKCVRMPSKPTGEGRKLSAATINKVVGILRTILDEAVLRYGISNPCESLKRLKVQRKDIEPFSLGDVQQILARVRTDYRPYLIFRFFTAVRSGEVHGLKWKHIDFERRQVLIRETFQSGRTEYTKTDGSQREIHMSQPVYDALSTMCPDGYNVDPKAFDDQYVFPTRHGKPIDNTNFNDRVWKPLLRNLGLRYRRPYQMRHTCATLWLAAGESPEWIARQLGHTTTEMLFRTYSRYVPNLMRRDGLAFDSLVSGALNGGVSGGIAASLAIGHATRGENNV